MPSHRCFHHTQTRKIGFSRDFFFQYYIDKCFSPKKLRFYRLEWSEGKKNQNNTQPHRTKNASDFREIFFCYGKCKQRYNNTSEKGKKSRLEKRTSAKNSDLKNCFFRFVNEQLTNVVYLISIQQRLHRTTLNKSRE
jgi:hypothetical protein